MRAREELLIGIQNCCVNQWKSKGGQSGFCPGLHLFVTKTSDKQVSALLFNCFILCTGPDAPVLCLPAFCWTWGETLHVLSEDLQS